MTWEHHFERECEEKRRSAQRRKKNKKVCPAPGCKRKLTETNSITCRGCKRRFCIQHRMPSSHQCRGTPSNKTNRLKVQANVRKSFPAVQRKTKRVTKEKKMAAELASVRQMYAEQYEQRSAAGSSSRISDPVSSCQVCPLCQRGFATLDELVRHSATCQGGSDNHRYKEGGDKAKNTGISEPSVVVPGTLVSPNVSVPGREVCPECGARFYNAVDLVAHYSSCSGTPGRPENNPQPEERNEICPTCGLAFQDVSQLIAHVEMAHDNPILPPEDINTSGGQGKSKSSCCVS